MKLLFLLIFAQISPFGRNDGDFLEFWEGIAAKPLSPPKTTKPQVISTEGRNLLFNPELANTTWLIFQLTFIPREV